MSQTADRANAPTVQTSIAEVWYLKDISFNGNNYKIITQNFNGPCSFIAICNILILRGNIEILPPTRRTASYEFLSHLVADYILSTSPNVDISAALSVMPLTQKGMDLNPVFTSSTAFRPSGSIGGGGELQLFEHVGIPLLHGWLVDPESPDAGVFERVKDYDAAVELIAEVDHLTDGQFVINEDEFAPLHGVSPNGTADPTRSTRTWTPEELKKVEDAIVIRRFLDSTQSQLTYHGLFHLATSIPTNSLCALFRNSHLSVLYKHASGPEAQSTKPPAAASSVPPEQSSADPEPSSSSSKPDEPQPSEPGPSTSTSAPKPEPTPPSPPAQTEPQEENSAIYSLVTDQVFLHEPSVVWERFEDIDGGWSTFVDSHFVRASPAGGDFAGQTAEDTLRAAEHDARVEAGTDPNDIALARQLQAEEENLARQEHEAFLREQQDLRRTEQAPQPQAKKSGKDKKDRKKDCVIM